jgi:hypothetical protein
MKTDELINALAVDAGPPGQSARRVLALAVLAGAAVTTILLLTTLGLRADLREALLTWRFDLKLLVVAAVLLAALGDCVRFLRPESKVALHWSSVLVILLLATAVAVEFVATPHTEWGQRLVGTNSLVCLVAIPMLALAPFIAILWAMRNGAPASPAWAGAAAGRLAAAIGATLYAFHCFDDSPLFVAVWYSAAILLVSALGGLIGARILRW